MLAKLRPVETSTARNEHEQVIVRTAAHDDRAQKLPQFDPLQLGALLGAASGFGLDHAMWDVVIA
jgi:hypothetical protein